MKVTMISGSSRIGSSNILLLKYISTLKTEIEFNIFSIGELPLFTAEKLKAPLESSVLNWKKSITDSDLVIISTPEYLHNLPGQLKSALEWFAASGELVKKRCLAIIYTPSAPRGEKALQSLTWSLQALDANIIGSLSLYHEDISFNSNGEIQTDNGGTELIMASLEELIE